MVLQDWHIIINSCHQNITCSYHDKAEKLQQSFTHSSQMHFYCVVLARGLSHANYTCTFKIVCHVFSIHRQACLNRSRMIGKVGIPINGLILPHFCACPKPGHGFPTSYVMILFLCSMSWGERWLFVLLICWPSLFKFSFHNLIIPESSLNQTLNKVPMCIIFLNFTCMNRTHVYSEQKTWSKECSV